MPSATALEPGRYQAGQGLEQASAAALPGRQRPVVEPAVEEVAGVRGGRGLVVAPVEGRVELGGVARRRVQGERLTVGAQVPAGLGQRRAQGVQHVAQVRAGQPVGGAGPERGGDPAAGRGVVQREVRQHRPGPLGGEHDPPPVEAHLEGSEQPQPQHPAIVDPVVPRSLRFSDRISDSSKDPLLPNDKANAR
ncbi:hypothetical protein ACPPVO_48060 [Dactylosporangium sp. McL0621]|uniref:hypothetical protein n=1 Tax=Dactylosporangium sp. McL0621 TaxID=3415678 RepID=UPI003CE87F31